MQQQLHLQNSRGAQALKEIGNLGNQISRLVENLEGFFFSIYFFKILLHLQTEMKYEFKTGRLILSFRWLLWTWVPLRPCFSSVVCGPVATSHGSLLKMQISQRLQFGRSGKGPRNLDFKVFQVICTFSKLQEPQHWAWSTCPEVLPLH